MDKNRLEAFSDGVIAIIITIMVLELKVPHPDGVAGLRAIFPILLVYLLSFAFTGIYWINHQHLLKRVAAADRLLLCANLWFLFCLSLLPFFTSYVLEKKISSFAVAVYAASLTVTGFAFLLLRLAAYRNLRRSGDLRNQDTAGTTKHLASSVLYLISIPLAFYHPALAMGVLALITAVWILPNMEAPKGDEEGE